MIGSNGDVLCRYREIFCFSLKIPFSKPGPGEHFILTTLNFSLDFRIALDFSLWRSTVVLCFDLLTRPKMPFKVMHRKEVTHSGGSYERKSRGRKLADEMGRGKKDPIILS